MKPLSLQAVADEMTAYINRKTGELYTVTDEEAQYIEDDREDDDFIPDWQKKTLPKVREVLESDDFLALPDKYEIHEYSIMERFCYSIEDDDLQAKLLNAINGRGAFRYFKDLIHQREIQNDWYRYRDDAVKRIAADFLDAEGIAYVDNKQ